MESKLTFANEKKYRLPKSITFLFFYLHIFFYIYFRILVLLSETEFDNVKLTLFKLFSSGWQFSRINLHNEKSLKLFSTSLFFVPSHRGDFRDFPVCAESDLKFRQALRSGKKSSQNQMGRWQQGKKYERIFFPSAFPQI